MNPNDDMPISNPVDSPVQVPDAPNGATVQALPTVANIQSNITAAPKPVLRIDNQSDIGVNGTTNPYEQPLPVQATYNNMSTLSQETSSAPIKKSKQWIGIIIAALVVVIGGLAAVYFYIYTPSVKGSVSISDLQTKTLSGALNGSMTYLFPKQWSFVTKDNMYVNKAGTDGQSTAVMGASGINLADVANVATFSFTDTTVQKTRESLTHIDHSAAQMQQEFKILGTGCDVNSIPTDNITVDNSKTALSWGYYYEESTCTKDKTELIMKIHEILGNYNNEVYKYGVIIAATKSNWDQNKEAYQKILDGVKVIN